jgi:rhodanese-related sulfurtransferase
MCGTILQILDVRRLREYELGHIPDAVNIPLASLPERLYELSKDVTVAVVCAAGYRSAIAQSVLERAGHTGVINVLGGTESWDAAGYLLETEMVTASVLQKG